MRISAVIVNYGRASDTLACVASLRADASEIGVVVVDNASPDPDVEMLAAGLPEDVILLRAEANLGYAGGNNLGMRRALQDGPNAIFVLNNDVLVEPGCAEALEAALDRHPDWGVAGPLSLLASDPGRVDFFAADVDLPNVAIRVHGRDDAASAIPGGDRETDYVTGSAMLLRRTALERVGFFDERYFLVWEDVDLCLRMREDAQRCGVTSSARVLHARSASFGSDGSPLHRYYFVRNTFLVLRTHLRGVARYKAEALAVRRYSAWAAGTTPMHAAIRAGLKDGMFGRWGRAPESIQPSLAR